MADERPLLQDRDPPDATRKKRFRRCRTAPSSEAQAGQDSPPTTTSPNARRQGDDVRRVTPKEIFRGSSRPSFRLVGAFLLAYLAAGTTAFYLAMDHMSGDRTGNRALDALYFCVVTMTTVGYGDLVPSSDAAKLLACAFAFAGVALVGTFLSKAADHLVEKQEALLHRALHLRGAAMEAKNKVQHKLYTSAALLAVVLASGMAFLVTREGMRPVDAFYCACVTVTTLGYGDGASRRRPAARSRRRGSPSAPWWSRFSSCTRRSCARSGGSGRWPGGCSRAGPPRPTSRRPTSTATAASAPRTSCSTSSRSSARSARRRSLSSSRSSTSSTPITPAHSRPTTSSWRSTVSAAITGGQRGR